RRNRMVAFGQRGDVAGGGGRIRPARAERHTAAPGNRSVRQAIHERDGDGWGGGAAAHGGRDRNRRSGGGRIGRSAHHGSGRRARSRCNPETPAADAERLIACESEQTPSSVGGDAVKGGKQGRGSNRSRHANPNIGAARGGGRHLRFSAGRRRWQRLNERRRHRVESRRRVGERAVTGERIATGDWRPAVGEGDAARIGDRAGLSEVQVRHQHHGRAVRRHQHQLRIGSPKGEAVVIHLHRNVLDGITNAARGDHRRKRRHIGLYGSRDRSRITEDIGSARRGRVVHPLVVGRDRVTATKAGARIVVRVDLEDVLGRERAGRRGTGGRSRGPAFAQSRSAAQRSGRTAGIRGGGEGNGAGRRGGGAGVGNAGDEGDATSLRQGIHRGTRNRRARRIVAGGARGERQAPTTEGSHAAWLVVVDHVQAPRAVGLHSVEHAESGRAIRGCHGGGTQGPRARTRVNIL